MLIYPKGSLSRSGLHIQGQSIRIALHHFRTAQEGKRELAKGPRFRSERGRVGRDEIRQ